MLGEGILTGSLNGLLWPSFLTANDGEFNAVVGKTISSEPVGGLLILAAATLPVANLSGLSSISMMGSAGLPWLLAAENAENARVAERPHTRPWVGVVGFVACLAAPAAGPSGRCDWTRLVVRARATAVSRTRRPGSGVRSSEKSQEQRPWPGRRTG